MKKNLKVQVAALAMTGAMVAIPMNARAEDANPATATSAATSGTTEAATGSTAATAVETATGATTGAAAETVTGATAGGAAETATAATATGTAVGAGAASEGEESVVTVEEAAVDSGTTAPNNVNTVLSDDQKQGTDISTHADKISGGETRPVIHVDATVTAEEAKGEKTIAESLRE